MDYTFEGDRLLDDAAESWTAPYSAELPAVCETYEFEFTTPYSFPYASDVIQKDSIDWALNSATLVDPFPTSLQETPPPMNFSFIPASVDPNGQQLYCEPGIIEGLAESGAPISTPSYVPRARSSTFCLAADSCARSTIYDDTAVLLGARASTGHTGPSKRLFASIEPPHPAGDSKQVLMYFSNGNADDAARTAFSLNHSTPVSSQAAQSLRHTTTGPEAGTSMTHKSAPAHKRRKGMGSPLLCGDCGKPFKRQGELTKHVKGTHLPGGHVCTQCGHVFHWDKDLVRHLRSVHKGGPAESSGQVTPIENTTRVRTGLPPSAHPSSAKILRAPLASRESRDIELTSQLFREYSAALSKLSAHVHSSAAALPNNIARLELPGLLAAADVMTQCIGRHIFPNNIKHADLAALATLYGFRWVRKSGVLRLRLSMRRGHHRAHYEDWNARSESLVGHMASIEEV